jgi:hypothetical protein
VGSRSDFARLAVVELIALPSSGRTSAVVVCRIDRSASHVGAGGARNRAISIILEHLRRRRDLGQLERDVAAMTAFAPILISFSRRLVSDHGSAALGIASVRMKLARL